MQVKVNKTIIVDVVIQNVNRGLKNTPAMWVIFLDGFNLFFDNPALLKRSYATKREAIAAFNAWKEGV